VADNYDVNQDRKNDRRKMLLEDLETAEVLAKPYLSCVSGKLLMGNDYGSFGGLKNATGASAANVDKMSQNEESVWVASRPWAVCQKIRLDKNPGAEAGQELAKYKGRLEQLESNREKSSSGGKAKRGYSDDLNKIIAGIIPAVESENTATNKRVNL